MYCAVEAAGRVDETRQASPEKDNLRHHLSRSWAPRCPEEGWHRQSSPGPQDLETYCSGCCVFSLEREALEMHASCVSEVSVFDGCSIVRYRGEILRRQLAVLRLHRITVLGKQRAVVRWLAVFHRRKRLPCDHKGLVPTSRICGSIVSKHDCGRNRHVCGSLRKPRGTLKGGRCGGGHAPLRQVRRRCSLQLKPFGGAAHAKRRLILGQHPRGEGGGDGVREGAGRLNCRSRIYPRRGNNLMEICKIYLCVSIINVHK